MGLAVCDPPAVLFPAKTLDRIAVGEVTLALRRQRRPTVKAGGTLRTRVGMLAIESVQAIEPADVTAEDARRAGHESVDAALAALRPDGTLYRIAFHLAGEDPRIALRARARLSDEERAAVDARLARLDKHSTHGPWTEETLRLIAARPEVRAADLAEAVGRARLPFKADVRKLKELGLTESLERGYRLSPRGRAYLAGRLSARSAASP